MSKVRQCLLWCLCFAFGVAVTQFVFQSNQLDVSRHFYLNEKEMQTFHYMQQVASPLPRDQTIQEEIVVDNLVVKSDACVGKEKLLKILINANVNVTTSDCGQLPLWSDVEYLYGDEPIVYGLETCRTYREYIQNDTETFEPKIRVGGLYNTGTNAFVNSLMLNFKQLNNRLDYNLPGWKHASLSNRMNQSNCSLTPDILPVLLIRDPFRWMRAMCKTPYQLTWRSGLPNHCPNLVPSESEKDIVDFRNVTTFQVLLTSSCMKEETYDSLVDYWSTFNREYLRAEFPRLIIRFEDTLFHAEKVMKLVSDCVGRPFKHRFQYQVEKAKKTRKSSNFITALQSYGTEVGRYDGMLKNDFEYAAKVIDADLLKIFHYLPVPVLNKDSEFQKL